jgi:hypothetical protein
MLKQIISIHGRAETGVSRPFLCEDALGQSYFVKRSNVTWDQLILEYVIGHLAMVYGIPTATFELLEIPKLLANQTLAKDRRDFEPGIAFGSKRIPFGEDLGESLISRLPEEMKIAVICFDWWISNSDRRLTKIGGSPNIIWDPIMQSMMVIDHDRAIDPAFDPGEFLQEHVFRDVRAFIEKPVYIKWRKQYEASLKSLPKIWKSLPKEWLADESGSPRAELTQAALKTALLKPRHAINGILPI